MKSIRAFFAISLSDEIYQRLEQVIEEDLQHKLPGAPLRWVSARKIHLTIKFLGNISVSDLDLLKKAVQVEQDAIQLLK